MTLIVARTQRTLRMHFLLNAATGNYIKPVKAQIRMKGECFRENVTTVTRGHFARDCPKRNWKSDSASTPGKGRKVQGAACCTEKQNLCDEFPALPVYTSREFGESNWIIDSGATQHMTFEKDCLSDYVEFKQPCVVNLGDNCSILAYGKVNY